MGVLPDWRRKRTVEAGPRSLSSRNSCVQVAAHTLCSTRCEPEPFCTVQVTCAGHTDKQHTCSRPPVLSEHKEPTVRASHYQSVPAVNSLCTVYTSDQQVNSSCQMCSWHQERCPEQGPWLISTSCACAAVICAIASCRDRSHLPVFFP